MPNIEYYNPHMHRCADVTLHHLQEVFLDARLVDTCIDSQTFAACLLRCALLYIYMYNVYMYGKVVRPSPAKSFGDNAARRVF